MVVICTRLSTQYTSPMYSEIGLNAGIPSLVDDTSHPGCYQPIFTRLMRLRDSNSLNTRLQRQATLFIRLQLPRLPVSSRAFAMLY